MKLKRTIGLHLVWFPALFMTWLMIAGKSGSPVPHNWPQLSRILHTLEVSFLVSLLLLVLAPVAWFAAARGKRWAVAYPILLFLNCGVTVALSVWELAHMPPEPVPTPPLHRCFRFSKSMPTTDATGRPLRPGDRVVLRSFPGSDNPKPDTSDQAFQRKVWDGRIVIVTGFVEGGAIRVRPTEEEWVRDEPHFCVWPDNVVYTETR